MKAKDVNPYDLSSVAAAKNRLRTYVRAVFRKPTVTSESACRAPAHRGIDEALVDIYGDTPIEDVIRQLRRIIERDHPETPDLSPEQIRRLPDRAQGAYQSAAHWAEHGELVRYLCEQLAYALFERDRYEHDLCKYLAEESEKVKHRPGNKEESDGV